MRLAVGLLAAFAVMAGLMGDALAQGAAGRRIALVIGNAAYADAPLRTPINDARAMADVLRKIGFEVVLREDASKADLERAIHEFGERLPEGATALFYYAGHAVQANGYNYLLPVDAIIPSEQRVRLEAVNLDIVHETLGGARAAVSLVILDANRDNPQERRFRRASSGLAQTNMQEDMLVAYAAAPGRVAPESAGRNSLFTEELMRAMQTPGSRVEEVFKAVRTAVSRRSNGAQTPWESSSLTRDFYFVPPPPPRSEPVVVAAAPPAARPPAQLPAQTASRTSEPIGGVTGQRVALVVGNAGYAEGPLRNPINDARAIAEVLRQQGFAVTLRENGSKLDIERSILDFGEKLNEGAVGLFYYAGHAMELGGRNFLIPIDAQPRTEHRIQIEGVDLELVLKQMKDARSAINLVILDACRNNPFGERFRSLGTGGLAKIDQAPKGTLIAYSTAPRSVAADGDGKHSLYTEELLKAMQTPGYKVEDVFKAVRVAVSHRTGDAQIPWDHSSLTGEFYFVPPAPVAVASPEPVQTGPNRAAIELAYWDSVKGSTNPAELQAYLAQYPEGAFAGLAKARIAALAAPQPAPARAPAPVQAGPSRAELDARFWDSVKDSTNPAELQAYLAQFPDGTFAALARARLATLTAQPASPRAAAPPAAQQLAALPPATEQPGRNGFDGTYSAEVRVSLGSAETATITVRDLQITGRVGGACSLDGELESSGQVKRLEVKCTGVDRAPGVIRYTGAFARDPRTGQIVGQTIMDMPVHRFHGSRATWRVAGP